MMNEGDDDAVPLSTINAWGRDELLDRLYAVHREPRYDIAVEVQRAMERHQASADEMIPA